MNSLHERARNLLQQGLAAELSRSDAEWLGLHLTLCPECGARREEDRNMIGAIHQEVGSVCASAALVRRTRMAVRDRARQMHDNGERISLVGIASAIACLWAILSMPLIWEGTRWLAGHTEAPVLVWHAAAVFVWLMPAGLIVALGVWARGMRALET